jgi:hypothetical protein
LTPGCVFEFKEGVDLDNELDPTHRRTARMLPAIIANLMAFDRTMALSPEVQSSDNYRTYLTEAAE